MPRIRVETPCHPTENPEKVKAALLRLFPDLRFEREAEVVAGTSSSLDRLRELIRTQRIRDAARGRFLAGRRGNRTTVSLSKQAAYAGVVNFAAPSPLGAILLEIEDEDLTGVIDHIAESTLERGVTPFGRTEGT